ncbi:hypothetical protein BJ165DRAFT_573922 [Panaeolus papilionaceus]|nr:hypothetical protein BJ165DRAFT_573922 [Panaeolus papilionaceus]
MEGCHKEGWNREGGSTNPNFLFLPREQLTRGHRGEAISRIPENHFKLSLGGRNGFFQSNIPWKGLAAVHPHDYLLSLPIIVLSVFARAVGTVCYFLPPDLSSSTGVPDNHPVESVSRRRFRVISRSWEFDIQCSWRHNPALTTFASPNIVNT